MTDIAKPHKFADSNDPVPGIGTYVQSDEKLDDIKIDGIGNSNHTHPYGDQDTSVLMPQSRIRLTGLFHDTSTPANGSLSFTQSPCTHSDCTDEYRYWPAYREAVDDDTKVNKFNINQITDIGCNRWASSEKSSSDEGSWPGTTKTKDFALMNLANPGYCTNYESSRSDGVDLATWESNYKKAFKEAFAPGWIGNTDGTDNCCKYAAVNFEGSQNSYELNGWGFFISQLNAAEISNITYKGSYYDTSFANPARCHNKQTCGNIFWNNFDSADAGSPNDSEYARGGCPDVYANQTDACAGTNWKDPSKSSHWRESDICDCLDQGADIPSLSLAITGGFEKAVDRDDRNSNCLSCQQGQYYLGDTYTDDSDEECQKFCIDEMGGNTRYEIQVKHTDGTTDDYKSDYFVHQNIWYHIDNWNSELK